MNATGHSRLQAMLARLQTQQVCLDFAAGQLGPPPGVLLEVGLGKGRTYDHLRRLCPGHEIHVFDRTVHAPADCVPPAAQLWLGDFRSTLKDAHGQGLRAVLAHADFGSENRDADARLAAQLAPLLDCLLSDGALVLCDRLLAAPDWVPLALPPGVADWPYFMFRVVRGA